MAATAVIQSVGVMLGSPNAEHPTPPRALSGRLPFLGYWTLTLALVAVLGLLWRV